MTIEEAIFTHLTTTAGVSALVGDRVYPGKLPQNPNYPAVVYHRISGPREHSHDGSSRFAQPRFQLDLVAQTYAAAKGLAEAVRAALDGFRGTVGGVNGVIIDGVFIEDDDDGEMDDLAIWWFRQDYIFGHVE